MRMRFCYVEYEVENMNCWLVGYWHDIVMLDKFVVGWRDMVVV